MPEISRGNYLYGMRKWENMRMEHETEIFGNVSSRNVFLQPVDDHDLEEMKNEVKTLRSVTGSDDWCILTVKINDWNSELTPWQSGPVFGKEGFGSGAPDTLRYMKEKAIPDFARSHPGDGRRWLIGGYSLAGLFALWTVYQTDFFAGAAGVSPSVWYPEWIPYANSHKPLAHSVYLSLGDREEKTRNRVMAKVGDAIREQYSLLADDGIRTTLVWNQGNHFKDNGIRMGRGFAWLLKNAE